MSKSIGASVWGGCEPLGRASGPSAANGGLEESLAKFSEFPGDLGLLDIS
jgi:hypothetical protein